MSEQPAFAPLQVVGDPGAPTCTDGVCELPAPVQDDAQARGLRR